MFQDDALPQEPDAGEETPPEAAPPKEEAPPQEPRPPQGDAGRRTPPQGASPPEEGSPPEDESAFRAALREELDELIERLRHTNPEYAPPPFSPRALLSFLRRHLTDFPPDLQLGILERLRETLEGDLFDLDTWKGVWYMLHYTLEFQADFLKRRARGEYETDEWGLDPEFLDAVIPFFEFLYYKYWRVEVTGLENVPSEGRALLVSNHSGQLPFDGAMLRVAIYSEHPAHRVIRTLHADWFPTLPFFSFALEKLGQTLATEENGIRLLEAGELVAVYPEGYKGIGKLFKERYQLARFGRGGFARLALKTQSPIIPISVVGAEETYISFYKSTALAKLTGFPYFPIGPTIPWLGLLGLVPLPTKWYMDFGEPISLDGYSPEAAHDLVLVSQLTDQTRNIIQEMVYRRLAQRRSIFFG